MTALNINVLRIYYVDANADHTTCMNALADAGIYVVTTLGSPTAYINPYTGRWMDFTLAQYTSVVDSLASFTNVLGFDVGERRYNQTLPFLKAAVRDVKQHMRDKAYRDIPIGFTSAMLYPYSGYTELSYMACQEAQADFLGLAMADLTDITSCTPQTDIDAAIELYRNASIPVFGIETGCYTTDPSNDDRTFGYVYRFFAINATASLSGTVVLGFYQEVTRNSTWGKFIPLHRQACHPQLMRYRPRVCGRRRRRNNPRGSIFGPIVCHGHSITHLCRFSRVYSHGHPRRRLPRSPVRQSSSPTTAVHSAVLLHDGHTAMHREEGKYRESRSGDSLEQNHGALWEQSYPELCWSCGGWRNWPVRSLQVLIRARKISPAHLFTALVRAISQPSTHGL